ncbi:MAG TPA: fused MFS/spermidine synthase [Elusimicrobiales bacterium]|nr:fused MFS/spermidine synthase [Elusimicrobiales bacterium]
MKTGTLSWIRDSRDGLPAGRWFVEFFSAGEMHAHRLKKVLASSSTAFQDAVLVRSDAFGKMLVIDSETQSSEKDEFIYHEALAVPPLLFHPDPGSVLIMGGGEGATAREFLRGRGVRSVVMADIDHKILRFAREHMPSWHRGAFDDPRLRLLVQDARLPVLRSRLRFDIVCSDLPSPIEGGPAFRLYTLEFYRRLKKRLAPGGLFVTQAGPGLPSQFGLHAALAATLRRVFRRVFSYSAFIPSYDMPWTFLLCSDSAGLDPLRACAGELDRRAARRLTGRPLFADGQAIEGMFRTPVYYREAMKKNRRIITERSPMYFTTSQG